MTERFWVSLVSAKGKKKPDFTVFTLPRLNSESKAKNSAEEAVPRVESEAAFGAS